MDQIQLSEEYPKMSDKEPREDWIYTHIHNNNIIIIIIVNLQQVEILELQLN